MEISAEKTRLMRNSANGILREIKVKRQNPGTVQARAREIVGFAGSGPIFETENRFISRQEAEKSVHKTL